MNTPLTFDVHGRASLDGMWEFFPGWTEQPAPDRPPPATIRVPGLWEAQGYLDLDGVSWYRRRFLLDDRAGHWTLWFGAVMDRCRVYLNGALLGRHRHPFTPFRIDASNHLVSGSNVLDIEVTDPPVDDPSHIRSAHGKQGWANHVFPSRPSLYMTYGGIWQSVELRRHGSVVIDDVFVNGDPEALKMTVEVTNLGTAPATARLGLRAVGVGTDRHITVGAGETQTAVWQLGATDAARWSPAAPALHDLLVEAYVAGERSDACTHRFGLRTIEVDRDRLLLNGTPYRMKSVLVQGFRAEELYAEGDRDAIIGEVRAAQAMGFNTLRLHIKAFDPTYLDVCDALGMLLHCDLPVAEPIAHAELADGTQLSRDAVDAVTEQVRRDRNHPSIVLWSAMNELGLDGPPGTRDTEEYEQFARSLYAAVAEQDPTRPIIENDWVEPDPDRVFCSPILTAHWYGRLHADYLQALEQDTAAAAKLAQPVLVTEYGDWGLPDMPALDDVPFWDARALYAAGLAASRWPDTVERFIRETQRYQGISDRLQTEVFRRHDGVSGYCLTELTDVPHEFNGLLDLHRKPKLRAMDEMTRANQARLPVLRLDSLVATAGEPVTAQCFVANDAAAVDDVTVDIRFANVVTMPIDRVLAFAATGLADDDAAARFTESAVGVRIDRLAAHRVHDAGHVVLDAPTVVGNHDLLVTLQIGGMVLGENRYPIHVVPPPSAPYGVSATGSEALASVLRTVGASIDRAGPLVVAENALNAETGALAGTRMMAGGTVLLLAQQSVEPGWLPAPMTITPIATAWGSSVFHFTTDSGALPSLPRRNLLVGEDSTVQAVTIVTGIGGDAFPTHPIVIAYKPMPGAVTGSVVGEHRVGPGRLIFCQFRLQEPARRGDAAALAMLADLLRWAAAPRPAVGLETVVKEDGRQLYYYSFDDGPDDAATDAGEPT
jgi:hypothetical protein